MVHSVETVDAILAARDEGRTAKEIAARLGITRNAVIGLVNRARERGDVRAAPLQEPRRRGLCAPKAKPTPVKPFLAKPTLAKPRLPPRPLFVAKAEPSARIQRAPIPPEPVGFEEPAGTPLMQASLCGCRWIVGADARGALYCDAPRPADRRLSWCDSHYRRGVSRAGADA
jgi:hypothetical protein